jgi:hypothetical protein
MNEVKGCYFFIEGENEDDKIIRCMCIECHDTNFKKVGWFYNAKHGYGPFDYICVKCKKAIYKHTGNTDEKNETDSKKNETDSEKK